MVGEERMKLRMEYTRETDYIFSDNIAKYADWLEVRLAKLETELNETQLKRLK